MQLEFGDNGFIRTDRAYVRAMVFALLFFFACYFYGFIAGLFWGKGDEYDFQRIGFYRGQICYYSRSVAGASPPSLEKLVNSVTPLIVVHGFTSNLAAYTVVAIPLWPIPVVIGWPAFRWIYRDWKVRPRFVRNRTDPRRGFEPIMSNTNSQDGDRSAK